MSAVRDVLLLLAGGRSRRFGRDKALERFGAPTADHPGGEPLALRALRRLAPLAATRVLVRAAPLPGLPADVATCADPHPGRGPAQALAAAFAAFPAARWFVAPCDLPWLSIAAYRRLAAALDAASDATSGAASLAVATSAHGLEPLVSIWTPAAATSLARAVERTPELALHALLAELPIVRVADLPPACFMNVNTPADLAVACGAGEEE
ncbi:MAG: NTP transferase domain-containing protein [Planctomycetes bacterium]|nr:NTP transferase domain-containing protein [Planctomycetota bacterium]